MKTPKSAILFLERAADACYAAADDARALALYADAARLYRQAGDHGAGARCEAQARRLETLGVAS